MIIPYQFVKQTWGVLRTALAPQLAFKKNNFGFSKKMERKIKMDDEILKLENSIMTLEQSINEDAKQLEKIKNKAKKMEKSLKAKKGNLKLQKTTLAMLILAKKQNIKIENIEDLNTFLEENSTNQ